MPPILQLRDIVLTLGGLPLLSRAELVILPGDRIALVGRNGSGKSTLLRIAAGELIPDGGARFLDPKVSLRYLPQEPDLGNFSSVLEYILAGLASADSEHRARSMMAELDVDGARDPRTLSGGEARRAALVGVIAADADILLLDEPTNHLDLLAIEWLETALQDIRSAVCIVSHDRRLLSKLTRSTVWLDRGQSRSLDRGFAAFETWRDKILEDEERDAHKLGRKLLEEEHWMRYGVTARRKRNMRRVRELADLRQEVRAKRSSSNALAMTAQEAKTSGGLVIEAEHVSKRYGDLHVVDDFSIRVMRRDRIGIVGANGAGKTTLLNLLGGALPPDGGVVRVGTRVDMVSIDQRRASLNPMTTLTDAVTGGGSDWVEVNGSKRHVAGYLKDFLFRVDQLRTPIGKLSGGERARLMLARALTVPSNLLALDEPTNDLDLETLEMLQELIADYPGTVLVITHDREFLDRVVTSVVVSEGSGRWREFVGGYEDLVAQRGFGLTRNTNLKASAETTRTRESTRSAPKRKLSFHQKRALGELPKRIEKLQGEVAALETSLADGGFHARDPAGFARTIELHSVRRAELEAAENEWLELEMLREEIE